MNGYQHIKRSQGQDRFTRVIQDGYLVEMDAQYVKHFSI